MPKTKTEITELTKIDIVVNPEDNSLPYTTNPRTDAIEALCTINGYSMPFTFERNLRPSISLNKALELLNKGAISKTDFEGDPSKVLAQGTIANGAVINIKTLKLGNNTVEDVKIAVNNKLRVPLTLNSDVLKKVGNFTIDKKKKEFVFSEEE